MKPVNDIDFHPTIPLMASSSRDCTIKFYDYLSSVKKTLKFIQDSHNVRSICFHPSGDYLLSGTDHPLIRLYDLHSLQAYVTPPSAESQHNSQINQVRYSPDGKLYVSAAKEGNIKIWDAVNSRVITTISGAHSGTEVSSVQFSRNCKYLLSGGKDYSCKLWEISTGRPIFAMYATAPNIPPPSSKPQQHRTQSIFSWNEDFIITSDEINHSVAIFDARTAELTQRLTGHTNVVRWLAASPVDPYLTTCCDDDRVRLWVEEIGFKQK
jgi:cleavage stimulation factor subunit 1